MTRGVSTGDENGRSLPLPAPNFHEWLYAVTVCFSRVNPS